MLVPRSESFNARFRDECLNAHWFLTLVDARRQIETWRPLDAGLRAVGPAPTYIVAGRLGSTASASIRPPWKRGPMARHGRFRNGESFRICSCWRHESARCSAAVGLGAGGILAG